MFTEERPSFAGRHYRIDEALNVPRPVQPGGPRIIVGGSGEQRTLKIAAKHADMTHWFPLGLETLATEDRRSSPRHCEAIGRDPSTVERTMAAPVIVAATEAEARAAWERLPEERRATTVPATPEQAADTLRPVPGRRASPASRSTTTSTPRRSGSPSWARCSASSSGRRSGGQAVRRSGGQAVRRSARVGGQAGEATAPQEPPLRRALVYRVARSRITASRSRWGARGHPARRTAHLQPRAAPLHRRSCSAAPRSARPASLGTGIGGLLSRPKSEDVVLLATQRRRRAVLARGLPRPLRLRPDPHLHDPGQRPRRPRRDAPRRGLRGGPVRQGPGGVHGVAHGALHGRHPGRGLRGRADRRGRGQRRRR